MHSITQSPDARKTSLGRRLLADQQGVAALEFALLLPLLSTMLLATADLTLLASRTYQVQSLAQAAAQAITSLPGIPAAGSSQLPVQAISLPGKPGLPEQFDAQRAVAAISHETEYASPTERRQLPKKGSVPPAFPSPALPLSPSLASVLPNISIADLMTLPEGAAATKRLFWGCSVQGVLKTVTTSPCADGSRPAAYAEVIVRAPVNRLVAWPESLLSSEVEARAVVRLG